jgi:hypothetical protein
VLKLPAILWGVALTLWGGLLLNPWLLIAGLAVLALGLFVLGWDVGAAPRQPKVDSGTAAEPGPAVDPRRQSGSEG